MESPLLARLARTDTIAAPATVVGRSALAVLRVSGPLVRQILRASFLRMDGSPLPDPPEPRRVYLGWWTRGQERLDQTSVVYYAAPASYTGEEMLEITGHGGRAAVVALLSSLVEAGARLAEPGEFTLRAFLNGKLDLTEAEAVEAMVGSRNERARRLALRQLSGELSAALGRLRANLTDAAVEVETALEFPEEQLGTAQTDRLANLLAAVCGESARLLAAARREALYQRGYEIVILGRPNAGKSTLLNALLGRERALVSATAGTTRDLLTEEMLIGGRVFRLLDGAGVHDAHEPVEAMGIDRILAAAESAWAWLLVVDAGDALAMRATLADLLAKLPACEARKFLVPSKIDLHRPKLLDDARLSGCFPVSGRTGEGVPELLAGLEAAVEGEPPPEAEDVFLLSGRQLGCLDRLVAELEEARRMLAERATLDLLAEALRRGHAVLAELLGEKTRPDLLAAIFERFCIGK